MTDASVTKFTPQIDPDKGRGLTEYVARFVVETGYDDLPQEVIELGKKSILDGLGLALSGSVAKSGELVRAYLRSLGLAGAATVIGSGMKVPARFAAFANGVGIHADDCDDTLLAVGEDRVFGLLTHPTAVALPAALAIAETDGLSGKEMMLAYHLGVEVVCKISEAISPRHFQHGFNSTATCGTFAAACAVAKLRGFDLDQTVRALGIAGSQSAGLRENFGTMTKQFHAGRSCESGVVAADLAALGWTATDKILEGPRGFFQTHGGGYDVKAIEGKFGNPWTLMSPGVSIKPHPSGSLTQPGMTEMLKLIKEHGITADQVEHVSVGTNHNMLSALIHHRPSNAIQAKFSMEFCMAILLMEGKGGLPEFTRDVVNRPDVKEMIERVQFGVHPEAEAAGNDKMTTIIEIKMKDGRTVSGRADFGKGSPANPMTYDEAADKFREYAAFAKWPQADAESIVDQVRAFEAVAAVAEMSLLLTARAA